MKHNMSDFDPYDVLIQAMERLEQLERQHNKLAHAFQKTEREFNLALQSLKHLQQTQLHVLSKQVIMDKEVTALKQTNK